MRSFERSGMAMFGSGVENDSSSVVGAASFGSLESLFMALAAVDSPSGDEDRFLDFLADLLRVQGLSVAYDFTGNLIASASSDTLKHMDHVLFACHGDKVSTGLPVIPISDGTRITSDGRNSIGADNKAAIAALLWGVAQFDLPLPLEIAITRNEEEGLVGARSLQTSLLRSRRGVSLDGESMSELVISADHWFQIAVQDPQQASKVASDVERASGVRHVAASAENGIVNVFAEDALSLWDVQSALRSTTNAAVRTTVMGPGFRVPEYATIVREVMNAAKAAGIPLRTSHERIGNEACIYNARGIEMVAIGVPVSRAHEPDESVSIASIETLSRIIEHLIRGYAGR